jgi:uncharacterized membrane protein (GlpM family)
MNDLPIEIWEEIVKQNDENIFDKAKQLPMKELDKAINKIKFIYWQKRFEFRKNMEKHVGDIMKIKYKYRNKEEENLFVLEKCCDNSISAMFIYESKTETPFGYYTSEKYHHSGTISQIIEFLRIINFEIVSSRKELDKKRSEVEYKINDLVSYYRYRCCYFFISGEELATGIIQKITKNYYFIKNNNIDNTIHRIPKHHIIQKLDD